jgi:cold shock CspA family protein
MTARLTGLVKWFNNKTGYGFLKVLDASDDDNSTADVFVHYSNINVEGLEYTYLVQGEYVEFDKAETDNEEHKFQAVNLTGIKGGPLMCQTRFANKPQPSVRQEYEERRVPVRIVRRDASSVSRPRRRPESSGGEEDREFTKVVRKSQPRTRIATA